MSLKNGRPQPVVYPPAEKRSRRAAQSARAILAGRGDREKHWDRIGRCFTDLPNASTATAFAHRIGMATIPMHLLDAAFPPEPEPTAEVSA